MTLRCPNGHPVGAAVLWDPGGGGPVRCVRCMAPLYERAAGSEPDPSAWPAVFLLLVGLLVFAAAFWWLWFAKH